MKRDDLRRLFAQARRLSGETDYVVFGSLAALGYAGEVPPRMAMSVDVDACGKGDPARIFEIAGALGQGSAFEAEHGYYLDPISPRVATSSRRVSRRPPFLTPPRNSARVTRSPRIGRGCVLRSLARADPRAPGRYTTACRD